MIIECCSKDTIHNLILATRDVGLTGRKARAGVAALAHAN